MNIAACIPTVEITGGTIMAESSNNRIVIPRWFSTLTGGIFAIGFFMAPFLIAWAVNVEARLTDHRVRLVSQSMQYDSVGANFERFERQMIDSAVTQRLILERLARIETEIKRLPP